MSNKFVRSTIVCQSHKLHDNPFPVQIFCLSEYLSFTHNTKTLIEELEAMGFASMFILFNL